MNNIGKYRGKSLSNREWVYGNFVKCPDMEIPRKDDPEILYYIFSDDSFDSDEVDPKTVGQFTGKTDKNGVELYGGDKLDSVNPTTGYNYTIVWNTLKSCFEGVNSVCTLKAKNFNNRTKTGTIHD